MKAEAAADADAGLFNVASEAVVVVECAAAIRSTSSKRKQQEKQSFPFLCFPSNKKYIVVLRGIPIINFKQILKCALVLIIKN